jgi:hypothetical protein
MVNNIIADKGRDYISYKFVFVSYQSLLLHNTLDYANSKSDGKKSPYKIIEEVLTKAGYKFDTNFIDTDNRINLITSRTSTILDTIDYCLHHGISRKSPPSYFFTRILDDTGMLFNTKSENEKITIAKENNILFISADENKTSSRK